MGISQSLMNDRQSLWVSYYGPVLLFYLMVFAPATSRATPGLRPARSDHTLEAFLRDAPHSANYFPRRRSYTTPTVVLLETESGHKIMMYRDLGGSPYGIPVIMDLSEFARYKFQNDVTRIAEDKLGNKVEYNDDSEGLLNIDIPIRVPRGLSAITGEGETNLSITGRRRIELSGLSQYTLG